MYYVVQSSIFKLTRFNFCLCFVSSVFLTLHSKRKRHKIIKHAPDFFWLLYRVLFVTIAQPAESILNRILRKSVTYIVGIFIPLFFAGQFFSFPVLHPCSKEARSLARCYQGELKTHLLSIYDPCAAQVGRLLLAVTASNDACTHARMRYVRQYKAQEKMSRNFAAWKKKKEIGNGTRKLDLCLTVCSYSTVGG